MFKKLFLCIALMCSVISGKSCAVNNRTFYQEGSIYQHQGEFKNAFTIFINKLPLYWRGGLFQSEKYNPKEAIEVTFSDGFGEFITIGCSSASFFKFSENEYIEMSRNNHLQQFKKDPFESHVLIDKYMIHKNKLMHLIGIRTVKTSKVITYSNGSRNGLMNLWDF